MKYVHFIVAMLPLTMAAQVRPYFEDFKDAYGEVGYQSGILNIREYLGGEVNDPVYKNTCTMRMSYGVNFAGIPLPRSHNKNLHTFKISDEHNQPNGSPTYLCLSVIELKNYFVNKLGWNSWGGHDAYIRKSGYSDMREEEWNKLGRRSGLIAFDWGEYRHFGLWDGYAEYEEGNRGLDEFSGTFPDYFKKSYDIWFFALPRKTGTQS